MNINKLSICSISKIKTAFQQMSASITTPNWLASSVHKFTSAPCSAGFQSTYQHSPLPNAVNSSDSECDTLICE